MSDKAPKKGEAKKPDLRKRATGSWKRGPVLDEDDDGRDREILRWITKHGVVTSELVGWRFYWRPDGKEKTYGKWAVARRLAALHRLGLIVRTPNPYAEGERMKHDAIRVSRKGAKVADIGIREAPRGVLSELRHALAVVELTETLLDEYPGAELTTEREIRAERYRELREGEREPERGRTPDALLRIPAKGPGAQGIKTVAIELDLSRKDRRAMENMVRQYDRERVDEIWWYVAQESAGHVRGKKRVDRVQEVVREMKADNRIEVRVWRG
jgi:transcriptional regulator of met regulon